jgi:peptidoglycan hydrolase CwlO-like protein
LIWKGNDKLVEKMKRRKLLLVALIIVGAVLAWQGARGEVRELRAQSLEEKYEEKKDKIEELEKKIEELQAEEKTLTSQIAYMDGQIRLTELKIGQTEDEVMKLEGEIGELAGKISRLDISLDRLSLSLLERISQTYRQGQAGGLELFLSSSGFSEYLSRSSYLRFVQKHDRKLLLSMEETRMNYDQQKKLKEQKQMELNLLRDELGRQKLALGTQKQEKQTLIEITRNEESRFQELLDEAQKEMENLWTAFSALPEGEKKFVGKGDVIGVMGNTGFSTGPHLHFAVYHEPYEFGSSHENPLSYLESKEVLFDSTSCDDVPEETRRSVGSGSHQWPMNNIRLTQCYGHTPWSWRYSTNYHDGIDMVDDEDRVVRAVEEGEAVFYRGGQSAGNGVFIYHPDGKMTIYWHLQ